MDYEEETVSALSQEWEMRTCGKNDMVLQQEIFGWKWSM